MPVPFWLGNQFNFAPAKFQGYTFPQPQAQQQGLFAPPPSLFQAPWNQSGGEGQNQDGPPGTGVPGPVGGPAQEISDFATNPGMRGMAMGVPGLGLALGLANLGAQYSMAPPGEFSLANAIGAMFGMQPSTEAITSFAIDPMGNFSFADAPFGSFDAAGHATDSSHSDSASASPGGHASGPGGDPGVGGGEGGGAPGVGGGDDGSGDGVGGAAGGPGGDGDGGDGWAEGGRVTIGRLVGMNPPGPDDGYGALDAGEFVLTAKAAKKIGAKNLAKLNKGKFDKAALAKALRVKKSKLKKVRQPGGN